MATRGFSFKGLVDYVLSLKDSVLANTAKIDTSVTELNTKIDGLTADDVDALPLTAGSAHPVSDKIVFDKNFGTLLGSTADGFADLMGINNNVGFGGVYIGFSHNAFYTGNATEQPKIRRAGVNYNLYHEGNKPTPADLGVASHVIKFERSVRDSKNTYWIRHWSDGFADAGGRFHTSICSRDVHKAILYNLPVTFDIVGSPYNLNSSGTNCTSTYIWESGDAYGDIRGQWLNRFDGSQAPESIHDWVSWSASGFKS